MDPVNFKQWIEDNRDALRPPVCNKVLAGDGEFIVMVVGGPNARKDYHWDEAEEFFYQVEGSMVLKTMQDGKPVDIEIGEGEMFVLPARVPHSPQRFADTVGLVVERRRRPDEQDGLMWFCENCNNKLYEEYFQLDDIETQFPPVFDRFFGDLANRTCDACGAVMDKPD